MEFFNKILETFQLLITINSHIVILNSYYRSDARLIVFGYELRKLRFMDI